MSQGKKEESTLLDQAANFLIKSVEKIQSLAESKTEYQNQEELHAAILNNTADLRNNQHLTFLNTPFESDDPQKKKKKDKTSLYYAVLARHTLVKDGEKEAWHLGIETVVKPLLDSITLEQLDFRYTLEGGNRYKFDHNTIIDVIDQRIEKNKKVEPPTVIEDLYEIRRLIIEKRTALEAQQPKKAEPKPLVEEQQEVHITPLTPLAIEITPPAPPSSLVIKIEPPSPVASDFVSEKKQEHQPLDFSLTSQQQLETLDQSSSARESFAPISSPSQSKSTRGTRRKRQFKLIHRENNEEITKLNVPTTTSAIISPASADESTEPFEFKATEPVTTATIPLTQNQSERSSAQSTFEIPKVFVGSGLRPSERDAFLHALTQQISSKAKETDSATVTAQSEQTPIISAPTPPVINKAKKKSFLGTFFAVVHQSVKDDPATTFALVAAEVGLISAYIAAHHYEWGGDYVKFDEHRLNINLEHTLGVAAGIAVFVGICVLIYLAFEANKQCNKDPAAIEVVPTSATQLSITNTG
jgi:hypothetical protein